ncbi:MAG TPA: DUF4394 domain-containing protein [Saprospiraceae bacterium]|nr:DUF4394 domain-containing protein [Saprospiraceae bacterium]HPI07974.1 DUF4394 domain-containing protein [Saprospiraceae bacterium]
MLHHSTCLSLIPILRTCLPFVIGFCFAGASVLQAQTIFGLSGGSLVSFNAGAPALLLTNTPVSGVDPDQVISGLDFRPATGELYALGYDSITGSARLYTINKNTAVATAIGAAAVTLDAGMDKIGFDFNPTVDRIRVTGSSNANYRLHPVTGALVSVDGDLSFAPTDVNAGANPSVGAVAYTNSYIGATATTLYNIDDSLGILTTQLPPNNGTLNTVGSLGIIQNLNNQTNDLDITLDAVTGANVAYFVASDDISFSDNLFTINLQTGTATLVGPVGLGVEIDDIAIEIDRQVPEEVTGQVVFALSGTNNLISFDSDLPGVIRSLVPVSGIAAGQVLAGMDFRPATGELFALGYNNTTGESRLYTIETATGVAMPVGTAAFTLEAGMSKIGFDFNPTVDRIRVTGGNNANYRLHPVTGAIAATDMDLAFAAADVNAGANPSVGAVAYTNSYIGAATTVLYNYDDSLNVLTTQIPPNNGTLNTIGSTGLTLNLIDPSADLDIFFDTTGNTNMAFLSANTGTLAIDNFYTINLSTGATSLVGKIGLGIAVSDIAVQIERTLPEEITGRLVYASTTNNNLVSFDSDLPGVIRSLVPVTGLVAGQMLSGMDFRPATGELYGLGYNNMTGEARLYTIDLVTGIATPVGAAAVTLEAGMNKIGFDFNPTVDRIRVTGSNNANYRMHPVTGAIAATDTDLAFAAGDPNAAANPSVGAVAYTNSFIGTTTTVLYNYDDSLNVLTTQVPPNNGVLNTVGATGLTVNLADASTDLDIFFNAETGANQALLSANTGASTNDQLYNIDLASGNATLIGEIGFGIPVNDIAVLIERFVPEEITGELVYALTAGNNLITFDSDLPEIIRTLTPVTGVAAGQVLAGMDFRPATGELYALGYNNTTGEALLYTIDDSTAVATAVGAAAITLEAGMNKIGFDFNPTVDRIRVTGSNNANYRLHPVTGAIAATDSDLAFAAADVNAAANPSVGAVAYTNSYIGATGTTLYNYEDSLNVLTTQVPPNNGTLNTLGSTGLTLSLTDPSADMDIYFDAESGTNLAFLNANTGGIADNFYSLNLSNGSATLIGKIGAGIAINDIAVLIERVVPEQVTGELVYALTANNSLISFDSELPEIIRELVVVTGVTAGQTLVGMDFRPATGDLVALGYNATNGEARLYNIDQITGVATALGDAAFTLALGAGDVGFDFNPTVDRIRVVGANNANYRLNPITGTVAATDMNLAYAAADVNAGANPAVGSVAYTNSFNGTTATTLYTYDDSLNVFTTQNPPNNGVLNTIGASGITVNAAEPSVDFDIYYNFETTTNDAYLSANTGAATTDQFYTVDLATGATTLVGKIGNGIAVRDIAVYLDSILVVGTNDPLAQSLNIGVWPNPAPQQAFLSFDLKESANIRLEVTDLAGRLVATLLDSQAPAGMQQVNWNVAQYPDGMYMVRLFVDRTLSGTAKLVVQHEK